MALSESYLDAVRKMIEVYDRIAAATPGESRSGDAPVAWCKRLLAEVERLRAEVERLRAAAQ